ncbi:MAG TPA: tRNA (adenosine(37)-N6)-dimethylallyltransferase MiaA [Candidatus Atribacteria bacterium]|nr:tRNA (adenosine(37)-N6)-dimethylallyltransferase MiaA [Candidatus Atribacteria bacterium]
MSKIPLVIITGPTAVGKTDLAIRTALELNSEIVSADSMQIYRYMNIGTAKPSLEERQGIAHHMIDIVDPDEEYSVARYQVEARETIEQIYRKGKIPILTGGTGLYINSVIMPMDFTEAAEDPQYREELRLLAAEKGNEYVHQMLVNIDPETAAKLHPNDIRRVIRALEVFYLTGRRMSDYRQDFANMESQYDIVYLGLNMNRDDLYERINKRVDKMIDSGLLDEVRNLMEMGYTKNLISMQGLGYKEMIRYLEGQCTLDESIEVLKRDTRRYAKRQLTWFRRDKRIEWLDLDNLTNRDRLCWIMLHIRKRLAL